MKYVKQFAIILVISFAGEWLHSILPLPVPASIYGLVIMFAALYTHILPLESVKRTGDLLIEIMPLMFIPAAVGLINSWDVLRPYCVPFLLITVVSTVVVMGMSGRITQRVRRNLSGAERLRNGD